MRHAPLIIQVASDSQTDCHSTDTNGFRQVPRQIGKSVNDCLYAPKLDTTGFRVNLHAERILLMFESLCSIQSVN